MKNAYSRHARRGDTLVPIYVPRALIEKVEANSTHPPTGTARRQACRYAFQVLFDRLLDADAHGRTLNVAEDLDTSVFLCQLAHDDNDSPTLRTDRRGERTGL